MLPVEAQNHFNRHRPMNDVRRVLIYRLGSLGDTVVALPCFKLIARVFPDAERFVLTNFPVNSKAAPLQAILGHNGLVDGYLEYPLRTRDATALLTLRSRIQALKPDALIYLCGPRGTLRAVRDILFFLSCGVRRIIGAPIKEICRNIDSIQWKVFTNRKLPV